MRKNKDDIIKFRCTDEEKIFLKKMAKDSGMTLSEYIRKVIFLEKNFSTRSDLKF